MEIFQADTDDFASLLNQHRDGWSAATGLRYLRATRDEVVAELEIAPHHLQGYGIVHGGVYAGVIETLASVGAALTAIRDGRNVVGLENHTSFLRAVRGGTLRAVARPLTRGRKSHLWEGQIHDGEGRLVSTGRVRLLCLAQEEALAGAPVTLQSAGS